MLEARHITYQLGRKQLLANVSLCARPGEFVAIAGANGAGKSTLLKTLSRELTPTSGQVLLDEKSLSSYSALDLARRRAVLAQQNPLAFPFQVRELVMMGRYPHFSGHPGPTDEAVATYVQKLTAIDHLTDRSVPTLSGGEQQRVYLAKVLAQLMTADDLNGRVVSGTTSRYLLLDEPTTGLDLYFQHSLLKLARYLTTRGYGIVAILHDLNLIMQYADQVLLLKEGQQLAMGLPATVLTPGAIMDTFGLAVQVVDEPSLSYPIIIPDQQKATHFFSTQTA
ncbi:heme ABC transporter ATP-binding protein [Spirosoma sp. KUDC1026]|uniref:heme ABC transporter ATP-binding protein n=1 Tax=Spirosoma sp. KUDC1026 TaxID=2745947 RepID=UPI00159B9675|nr:heme ABC transporter ATP-binding protein [Spirosoma sp. KUDC1026]QKZ12168.1 heme ABC transporter ATP-binding protein [Spirosoma sp. KUDC1026]